MKRIKKLFLARAAMTLLALVLTTTTAWADVRYNCYIEVSLNPPDVVSSEITDIVVNGSSIYNNTTIELEAGKNSISVSGNYSYMGGDPDPIEDSFDESAEFDVPTTVNGFVIVRNSYFSATITCNGIIKGGSIESCNFTVPNQTLEGPNDYFDNISYKFEYANNNYAESYAQEFIVGMGVVVKDGDYTLALGTDYCFGSVTDTNGAPITESAIGDECKVEIKGSGDYTGSKWATFKIVAPDAGGTWGDSDILTWAFHDGTLSITGTGEMKSAANNNDYPWFSVARYIETVTLGEGITTIAASAFAGTDKVHSYGNLTTLNLPSSLTTIGDDAFAFCDGLTINLDAFLAKNISIGNNAFCRIGCLTGSLADNANNATKIALLAQAATADVTLSGRTFYKDGNWNTLCLPFSLGDDNAEDGHHFDGTPFAGATVMTLNSTESSFDKSNGTLTLNFKTANSISAGTPYIIKWADGDNLANPEFTGVNVFIDVPTPVKSTDERVEFCGIYSPTDIFSASHDKFYLGIGKNGQDEDVSTLYYPASSKTLNAFRAYFQLSNPQPGTGEVKEILISFGDGDDADGINSLTPDPSPVGEGSNAWYDLNGRKLLGKPNKKGIYVNGGRKVVIQ